MVWSGNGPPEKEHPLTTIGACGFLFVMGLFITWGGWWVIKFAIGIMQHNAAQPNVPFANHRKGSWIEWMVLGGAISAIGLAFMIGAVWWLGKAFRAMVRGEMVE